MVDTVQPGKYPQPGKHSQIQESMSTETLSRSQQTPYEEWNRSPETVDMRHDHALPGLH